MRSLQEFNVVIEQDEEGWFIATVPDLPGCHTQANSLDTLMVRIKEAIELCLEDLSEPLSPARFIGVQRISI